MYVPPEIVIEILQFVINCKNVNNFLLINRYISNYLKNNLVKLLIKNNEISKIVYVDNYFEIRKYYKEQKLIIYKEYRIKKNIKKVIKKKSKVYYIYEFSNKKIELLCILFPSIKRVEIFNCKKILFLRNKLKNYYSINTNDKYFENLKKKDIKKINNILYKFKKNILDFNI
jgi:hypothetical protein